MLGQPEMTDEACRIVILLRNPGVVDVAAPMKHKQVCYDMLYDARRVMERTPDSVFRSMPVAEGVRIVIVMSMAGVVDVSAPLPHRELCYKMLADARVVIERFNDAEAPPMRPFSGAMDGHRH